VRIGEDAPRTKLTMAALVAAVTIQQLVHAEKLSYKKRRGDYQESCVRGRLTIMPG